ncbi:MAG: GNAT family N-acetyltransferase [Eubacteriales bacterium]|nr:GNAT family N-acetyltransferase [Eubacteriales bacterium]
MVEIREVKTKREQREFVDFPLKLYKGNPYFVPPLYGDELKLFRSDYPYYDCCEAVYFNAYENGKMVGRISGILQKTANELENAKRVRFTRFDSIDSIEVAKALFTAVEQWAKSIGMDTVCGPLGFSDLEREGLLVEGFDELSTFEEQYNFEYYGKLIEACGYEKEVDWLESKLYLPDLEDADKLIKTTDFILKRNKLHFGESKNIRDFINKYADDMFSLLDRSYQHLYGTVPLTDKTKKMLIESFMLIVDNKHVGVVLNEDNEVVCFGICFPSLAKAVQKCNGKLNPISLIRLLYAIKHPKVIDLALVGVDPAYANKGIGSAIIANVMRMLRDEGIEYAETNLNLETNYNILNQWKRFKQVQHKRRRSYVKTIE